MLPAPVTQGHLTDYGFGIHAIDSGFGRPLADAVHVIVHEGRAALVDTAVNASVSRIMQTLNALGLDASDIDWVLLTHVHLDHAGGAGQLMEFLPNARLAVHPRGARHMIDPSKLSAATRDVYGAEKALAMYGDIRPVPVERIVEVGDGSTAKLGSREFLFLDTPGHARHHVCIRDSLTGHVFTGDTFGFALHCFDKDSRRNVFPTLTPTQLEPDRLCESIRRILSLQPEAVYVTHYGRLDDIPRAAADLMRLIEAQVAIARAARHLGEARTARIEAGIAALIEEESIRSGWGLQGDAAVRVLASDVKLNAQGLEAWLDSL